MSGVGRATDHPFHLEALRRHLQRVLSVNSAGIQGPLKYELRIMSYELRPTSYELRDMSYAE